MKELLYPRSIALIGASKNVTKVGARILENILSSNYGGELFLVNRNERSIHGIPCFKDTKDLPAQLDVAIIAIPAAYVVQAIEELGKKNTKYAVIISAGFKEMDEDGAKREQELKAVADRYRIRLVGPNCLGVINTDADKLGYNGSFAIPAVRSGSVSLISQSGALISSFMDRADESGFGFNKILSVGNKSDLSEAEMLAYLAKDEKTNVIALYLEGIAEPVEFIKAIKRSKKPVVVLKAGRSKQAQEAIASHTGSIAGESQLVSTLLSEAGAIEVTGFEEFFDVLTLFERYQTISRYDVGVVTNAGGVGVLSVDAAEDQQVELSKLQKKTIQDLRSFLPEAAAVENPVDVLGDAAWDRYQQSMLSMLSEKHVGSLLVLLTPQVMTPVDEIARGIVELQQDFSHKVIVPVFIGGSHIEPARETFRKHNLAWYESPERALNALGKLYQFKRTTKNAKLWAKPTVYVKKSSITKIQKKLQAVTTAGVDFETLALISKEFDLPLPAFQHVSTEAQVKKAFKKLGAPCVMKVVSGDVLHRSDSGGVKVGIMTETEAVKFWKDHKKEDVILQEQASKGVEVFVGIKRDPEMGLFLVVGLGGIYAEILDDFAFASMPITKPYILKALKETKLYQILDGARGTTYDIQFVVDTIFQLNLFAISFPEIQEIDVNPIIVYEKGGSMVDFKVVVTKD